MNRERKPIQPDWEQSRFAKTVEGQIMLMVKKAAEDGHYIEVQALSWASIEQILLPRLIGWIAKVLKINLPKEIYRLNSKSLNFCYLCISHDEKLYRKLEVNRKRRNEIVHKLIQLENKNSINKLAKKVALEHLHLEQDLMKRFDGEVLIPSINLYRDGWNNALNLVQKMIRNRNRDD